MVSTELLQNPHIRLFGDVNDALVTDFLHQLDKACAKRRERRDGCDGGQCQVVVEVSSSGGTADNAYRIFEEIRLAPLKANLQITREVVADLENGLRIEHENFAQLIQGTDIGMEEICERAKTAWYLTAHEALSRKLVQQLI